MQRLLSFARALRHASTFVELLEIAQREVAESVGYAHVWMYVSEGESTDRFRLLAIAGNHRDAVWEKAPVLTVAGDAMMEEICRGDAPVVVEDARTDPRTDKHMVAPDDVAVDSEHVVWWKCDAEIDHEWQCSVCYRTGGSECPHCARQRPSDDGSIESVVPALADQWHPTLNSRSPREVLASSEALHWWKCPRFDDHAWESSLMDRISVPDCPLCIGRSRANRLVSDPSSTLAARWESRRKAGR